MVTELCPGGNLRKFLRKSRVISDTKSSRPNYITSTLSYRQLLKLATDVANGMAHLSAQKVFGDSLYYVICVIERIHGKSPGKNVKFKIQMMTVNLIYSSRGVRIRIVIYTVAR